VFEGRVVGTADADLDAFADASGTVYQSPAEVLPVLFAMQEQGGEPRAQYYTNDTSLSEADRKLSQGGFTGYIELSENVLSGDYYVTYTAGESMAAAYVGNSRRLETDDDAFELADEEVGIYTVYEVDLDVREIPDPEATGDVTAAGDAVVVEDEVVDEGTAEDEASEDETPEDDPTEDDPVNDDLVRDATLESETDDDGGEPARGVHDGEGGDEAPSPSRERAGEPDEPNEPSKIGGATDTAETAATGESEASTETNASTGRGPAGRVGARSTDDGTDDAPSPQSVGDRSDVSDRSDSPTHTMPPTRPSPMLTIQTTTCSPRRSSGASRSRSPRSTRQRRAIRRVAGAAMRPIRMRADDPRARRATVGAPEVPAGAETPARPPRPSMTGPRAAFD